MAMFDCGLPLLLVLGAGFVVVFVVGFMLIGLLSCLVVGCSLVLWF